MRCCVVTTVENFQKISLTTNPNSAIIYIYTDETEIEMLKYGKSGTDLIFTVNEFEYRIYREHDDDNIKNYHLVFFGDNEMNIPSIADTSPYEELDKETFYYLIMAEMFEDKNVGCEFDLG